MYIELIFLDLILNDSRTRIPTPVRPDRAENPMHLSLAPYSASIHLSGSRADELRLSAVGLSLVNPLMLHSLMHHAVFLIPFIAKLSSRLKCAPGSSRIHQLWDGF